MIAAVNTPLGIAMFQSVPESSVTKEDELANFAKFVHKIGCHGNVP